MNSLSIHRLNRYSELEYLILKTGAGIYLPYREQVYLTLNNIKPGESFILRKQVKKENLELFIKISCLYILETGLNCNIIFSDDYETIIGIKTDNNQKSTYHEHTFKRKQTKA